MMTSGIRLHSRDERWSGKEHNGGAMESPENSRPSDGAPQPMYVLTFLLLSLFVAAMACAATGHAAQMTLAWDANTEPDLGGYKIFYGTTSKDYDWSIDVGKTTTYTVANLTSGVKYYFAAKAYNTSKQESAYSAEVSNCTYSVSPTTAQFGSSAGTGTVSVTTQAGCPWTATSSATWLTITSGSSGSGSGTVKYSVSANTSTTGRTAGSTFAKNIFTVTQAGTGGTQSYTIIDDGQSGTTPVGSWLVSSSPGWYGARSLYSFSTTGSYTFAASLSGAQAVYLWWTEHDTRHSKVPVRIYNGTTLLATVYVNQTQNGGQWNYLGAYSFSGQARVQIMSTSSTLSTVADAVKFVPSS